MPPESPRIAELRRRVHGDPASIAFAQLAEEYRRAGNYQEAVKYCRNGLARHPGYLSARVTLGRALMELGELDDALREFDLVLRTAPDNLAAIRGVAEIHQRCGDLAAALDYYKRGLALARFDPDLEESVTRIAREISRVTSSSGSHGLSFEEAKSQLRSAPPLPPSRAADVPASAGRTDPAGGAAPGLPDAPIDFDALLAELGVPDAAPPPAMDMLLSQSAAPPLVAEPLARESSIPSHPGGDDVFARLEHELRAAAMPAPEGVDSAQPPVDHSPNQSVDRSEETVVRQLEAWLRVLIDERATPRGA